MFVCEHHHLEIVPTIEENICTCSSTLYLLKFDRYYTMTYSEFRTLLIFVSSLINCMFSISIMCAYFALPIFVLYTKPYRRSKNVEMQFILGPVSNEWSVFRLLSWILCANDCVQNVWPRVTLHSFCSTVFYLETISLSTLCCLTRVRFNAHRCLKKCKFHTIPFVQSVTFDCHLSVLRLRGISTYQTTLLLYQGVATPCSHWENLGGRPQLQTQERPELRLS